MNKVTRSTLGGRISAAWRALLGKPSGQITYGLRVIRCDECDLARLARHSFPADRCVCCGESTPEGRMVCPNCENGVTAGEG